MRVKRKLDTKVEMKTYFSREWVGGRPGHNFGMYFRFTDLYNRRQVRHLFFTLLKLWTEEGDKNEPGATKLLIELIEAQWPMEWEIFKCSSCSKQ